MEVEKLTGYPSIDKPWLKYYSDEAKEEKIPKYTIYEAIVKANQDNLNRTALEHYGKHISYHELFQRIDEVALCLAGIGITSGDTVSICMLNSPETFFLLYALNKIGAIANMVSPIATSSEMKQNIASVHTRHLFILDAFLDKAMSVIEQTDVETIIVIPSLQFNSKGSCLGQKIEKNMIGDSITKNSIRFVDWQEFLSTRSASLTVASEPNADALIVYTGGTTGGSKGVLLTNSSIVSTAEQAIISGKKSYAREHTWMQVIPLFVAYGVCCSLQMPLTVGMTLILRIPTAETISQLCKFKPNHIMYGPAMWAKFADENKNIDLSFLITAVSGGDRLSQAVEQKVNEYLQEHGSQTAVLNGYGMSEVGAAVTANHWYAHKLGSVGIPFTKNIVAAFDVDNGQELQYDQEGEICVCTPSMMKGYINNPKETANVIQQHDDGRLWVHTGDLGYVTEDGFVYISGRLKRFITVFDGKLYKKVFSLDIEKVLLKHPYVENCAVVPRNDEEHGQVGIAYIQLHSPSDNLSEVEKELRIKCENELDIRARPKVYRFVDEFPITRLGKVDYRELEHMESSRTTT